MFRFLQAIPALVRLLILLLAVSPMAGHSLAFAAEEDAPGALAEIIVSGKGSEPYSMDGGRRVVPERAVELADPKSFADLIDLAPSAHIQTNSRGETLVFLRNAGERQVAVFYDGALMNVPWDNRVDLSLLPAGSLSGFSVAKGVTGPEYGANVIGGALNFTSRSPLETPSLSRLYARRGEAGLWDGSAGTSVRYGDFGLDIGASHVTSNGQPLAHGANLPFSQTGNILRTNTDSRLTSAHARLEWMAGERTDLGLSMLYADGRKGVAPEGTVDPVTDSPRFWRYPDWHMAMAILSGEGDSSRDGHWKGSAWVQAFGQTIDSFAAVDYAILEDRQIDDDLTVGGRLQYRQSFGVDSLLLAFNGLSSTHKQRDTAFNDAGEPLDPESERLLYRQRTISLGAEYDKVLSGRLTLSFSGGLDWMAAPKTGDKPGIGDFTEWMAGANAVYTVSNTWFVRGGMGRKTRLPTLRELFGQAINRFLINPDLKAESALIFESAAGWQNGSSSFEIIPFATITSDTIDQRNVTVDGRRLRQRINLRGSRVLGVDVTGETEFFHGLMLQGHVTWMDVKRRPDFEGDFRKLSEKPEIVGRLALDYRHDSGVEIQMALDHRGRAFTLSNADMFEPLAVSTSLNIRLSYDLTVHLVDIEKAELFIRADNVTDTVIEPQLGLPSAGRWVSGGMSLRF